MHLDPVARELVCKVVFYGPGMSGKTTNLQFIHERAPKQAVGKMVSIDTASERTLHFDLLPLDLGTVQGYKCRFEFYTVPGQSYYAATRRLVLKGADGIVFVADSRREALDENIDSMNDMFDNLRKHSLPADIPLVVQYNKQDLPSAIPPEQLNPLLNHRGAPWLKAVAVKGEGVLDTMKMITSKVIERIKDIEELPASDDPSPSAVPQSSVTPTDDNKVPLEPKPGSGAETGSETEPESWVLTCHNCEGLLEVPHANAGDVYTCGSCGAPLEVVDGDRGLTRPRQSQTAQLGGTFTPASACCPAATKPAITCTRCRNRTATRSDPPRHPTPGRTPLRHQRPSPRPSSLHNISSA